MTKRIHFAAAIALLGPAACDFDSELAPRVAVDVVVAEAEIDYTLTDLGYEVELERCRVAIADIEFTTDGEQHASVGRTLHDWLIPTAYAHPGHHAGGEIVGELPGRRVLDWRADGELLGEATMLEALYTGVNFTFIRAAPGDGVPSDDPIIGHTFDIAGRATLDGQAWTFELRLDQDDDRRVIGAALDADIDRDFDDALALSMQPTDPQEGATVFDGVDFANLDDDGDGHVVLEPDDDAYQSVRRALQIHSHYMARPR